MKHVRLLLVLQLKKLYQQNHESWKRYTKDTQNVKNEEITKFVWNYQFKEMYLRYFAWQFIGKDFAVLHN